MKLYVIALVVALFLIAGCSKVYVCYDGRETKIKSQCPILKTEITESEAGKVMDNYGSALARAKGDTYTRVNLYMQNLTWYSTVLFTNPSAESVKQSMFRIDGKTGNILCQTGCDYATIEK